MSSIRLWSAVLALGIMSVSTVAAAQEEGEQDARTLFEAARVSYDRGRFELALEQFREAYRLSDRPLLLYNIATTLDRLRRDEEALATYRRFLELAPDSDIADRVREQLRILEARALEPTPEQEPSSAAPVLDPSTSAAADTPADGESVAEQWWFWALIGAVVAAGVGITVGVVVGSGEQLQPPIASANGIVFEL